MTDKAAEAMDAPSAGRSRTRAVAGFVIGVLLLAAAAWAVSRHQDEFREAMKSARQAAWWLVALALLLPVGNWLLMALSFWLLIRRHGRVGLGEMTCLIGAAWLLNYLPLRPGLFGRIAYHKAVNGIPVAKSVRATIAAIVCSGVAIVVLLGVAVVVHERASAIMIGGALAPLGLMMVAAAILPQSARWAPLVLAIRYGDLLVWTGRYLVVFAIIGHALSPAGAAAVACIVQIALLVPLVGNGLGLREWAVGLAAGALPPGALTSSGTLGTAIGLSADMANRAAEMAVAIPVGLISAGVIARRSRSQKGRDGDSSA